MQRLSFKFGRGRRLSFKRHLRRFCVGAGYLLNQSADNLSRLVFPIILLVIETIRNSVGFTPKLVFFFCSTMLRMNTKSKFIVENWHFKGEGRLRELSEFQEVLLVSLREIESRNQLLTSKRLFSVW